MTNTTILNILNDYLNNSNIALLLDLKEKLTEEVRKEACYKSNSKTKVNALCKLMKENQKKHCHLAKAFKNEDNFIFTNSYYMLSLKDSFGYETEEKDYSHLLKQELKNRIILNYDLITFNKKTKQEFTEIAGLLFNTDYLKQVIDTLGTDLDIYICKNDVMLYFENKAGEKGILLCCKKY